MPPPQAAAAISSRMTYSGNSNHANGCPATAKTSDKIIHLPTATGNHHSSTSATMSNIKSPNKSNVKKAATATTKVSFLVIKYVFLAMLILLVCGLLRINIRLIQRLDGATSTTNEEATAAAAMASAGEGVEGGHNSKKELLQLRLKALRSEVAMMKEKVEHSRKKIGHMKHILKQGDDGAAILTSNEDASERRKGGRVGDIDNSNLRYVFPFFPFFHTISTSIFFIPQNDTSASLYLCFTNEQREQHITRVSKTHMHTNRNYSTIYPITTTFC